MKSGFKGNPSREFIAAVEALKRLTLDNRRRAYAEAASAEIEEMATRHYGDKAAGRASWRRLLGEQPQDGDKLPGDDHIELRKGRELTYISHPYRLAFDDLREIVAICTERGLEANIDALSWYFPGLALRVTYERTKSANTEAA
jgi:hypothetical protein